MNKLDQNLNFCIFTPEDTIKKILVYTAYDDNHQYIGDLTLQNKLRYCKENNYDFLYKRKGFINLPISWDKIYIISRILQDYDYEYVLWMDADAFIHNKNIRIENILSLDSLDECVLIHSNENINCSSMPALERANKILKVKNDPFLWLSVCNVNGPCLGTFLIKKCKDSVSFLEFLLAKKDFHFDCSNWWDQRAFHHFLLNNEIDSSRINILPHNKMNAYWNDVKSEDFIVHLPATSREDRVKYFNDLNPYK
jgi:hypothetical protein